MEFLTLIQELNQGKQLANQLRNHLHPSSSSSSSSSDGILLIDKILHSYENALLALAGGGAAAASVKSALAPLNDRGVSKKRKVMVKWSEQVKVSSDSAIDGPRCDGFSWRKYGQKDILGSKFPRGYFRCSHRFTQGCLATKQVQKSDDDPTIYDVTYKGRHTCNKALHSNTPQEDPNSLLQHPMPPKQEQKPLQQLHDPSSFTFSSDAIRVKSENLDDVDGGLFQQFCDLSPMFGSEVQDDQSPFRESELSPTFESNDMFGFCCDFETGFISIPNSVTNISIGDLEEYFSFDNLDVFC
ncbi:probable WRKY transcription factor 53 [Benincasa hispida]|uniref:probable WRKY transcription factor 53 n=1 Tax=Benincasa hispida TaxID=102211 RepID=UPI0019009F12|nr:probable WRKY transcription factor 53 [Benincasa hispida]